MSKYYRKPQRTRASPGSIFYSGYLQTNGVALYCASRDLGVSIEELEDFIAGDLRLTPEFLSKISEITGVCENTWKTIEEDFIESQKDE